MASFCGSINYADFLTDPSGSRRFLPFEVISIDISAAQQIDIDAVWAEAYTLYKSGFKYWFDKEETNLWFEGNQEFQILTEEYELLIDNYEVVQDAALANVHLTTTKLMAILQLNTKTYLSIKRLGEALRKAKAIHRTVRAQGNVKVWYLRERSGYEKEQATKSHLPASVHLN